MTDTHSTPGFDPLPEGTVDVAVLGGGAAGLSGALMLARSRRSVVVIDAGTPRNAPADGIHGLLGHEGTPPGEYLERGRGEVRGYGGLVVTGTVAAARAADPSADGDLRFTLELTDGRRLTARRLLIATGLRDELPDVPGLAEHWGHGVVHCPYCHGWEVRDEPIGLLARGPISAHQALLFRQLTDDLVYFRRGTELDDETRERFDALGIKIVEGELAEVVPDEDGTIAGVRLAGGEVVERRVLAVGTTMHARTEGLEPLGLPMEELPHGMGRHIVTGMAGTTEVPGVWAAGNVAELSAQVGASAAAGALAGAHINAQLAAADADAAVAARKAATAA
ncbi:NAD(P)/FAD-dependent oxidoreductase [Brachybacterium sp. GCM10030267]|uniref:NAD(P)/FAD-dependent oxidoreductase n=1 Tax=Brachybacterium sp. GCM10030267 TaxID=3273381 RepID=UPI00361390E1